MTCRNGDKGVTVAINSYIKSMDTKEVGMSTYCMLLRGFRRQRQAVKKFKRKKKCP